MHVSGHTATYRTSVTANMNLIGELRFFWYRYRVQCDWGLNHGAKKSALSRFTST